ncbi:hypothetical protein H0H92_010837, partial [Tricholoma furcatifolium]
KHLTKSGTLTKNLYKLKDDTKVTSDETPVTEGHYALLKQTPRGDLQRGWIKLRNREAIRFAPQKKEKGEDDYDDSKR